MFLFCLYFVLYSYVWWEIQSLHTYKRYLWVLVYLYTRHSFKCSVCVLLFPFYQPYKVDVTIYIVKIRKLKDQFSSVQLLSHVRLCNPMDCSTPGFPVHHQLPELAQTHVHRVSNAIQASHPGLSPSPPAFSLSQHQGLFQ